jgi:hypothetical protein
VEEGQHSDLLEKGWEFLVTGQDDEGDFVEYCAEVFEVDPQDARLAWRHLRSERLTQQATFSDSPSNLTEAFWALQRIGILAVQDFSCCNSCGHAELYRDYKDSAGWLGPDEWMGYLFFHQQDTEHLVVNGTTWLSFGVFDPVRMTEEEWSSLTEEHREIRYNEWGRELASTAVTELPKHGIGVEWNGDLNQRIRLHNAEFYLPVAG